MARWPEVEIGIPMDPDKSQDTTPEPSRGHLVEERKKLFHGSRGIKVPVGDLTDAEYSEITGYNIVNKPEAVSVLERVREFLSHFPKPHTPQKQPV